MKNIYLYDISYMYSCTVEKNTPLVIDFNINMNRNNFKKKDITLKIEEYLKYLVKKLEIDKKYLISSLILFDRILWNRKRIKISEEEIFCLILICIVFSIKTIDDELFGIIDVINSTKRLELNLKELLQYERVVLVSINYDLFINEYTYNHYNNSLKNLRCIFYFKLKLLSKYFRILRYCLI